MHYFVVPYFLPLKIVPSFHDKQNEAPVLNIQK